MSVADVEIRKMFYYIQKTKKQHNVWLAGDTLLCSKPDTAKDKQLAGDPAYKLVGLYDESVELGWLKQDVQAAEEN